MIDIQIQKRPDVFKWHWLSIQANKHPKKKHQNSYNYVIKWHFMAIAWGRITSLIITKAQTALSLFNKDPGKYLMYTSQE